MQDHSEATRLGLDAQNVLNSPAFNKALDTLVADTVQQWKSTAPTDTAGREALFHAVLACERVRVELHRMLNDMKMLQHIAERAERTHLRR